MRVTDDITTAWINVLNMSGSHISCSHFRSHSRIHLITKHGVRLPGCSCLWLWTCSLDLECSSPRYLAVLHFPQIMLRCHFFQEDHFFDHPIEITILQHPYKNTRAPSHPSIPYFFHDTVTVWYDICVYVCIYSFIHSFSITIREFCLSYSLWYPSPTKWSLAPCWYSANTDSGILQVWGICSFSQSSVPSMFTLCVTYQKAVCHQTS